MSTQYDAYDGGTFIRLPTSGSGCGSVGRAVASNSRCPWFEFSHQQDFILSIIEKTVEKTKIKKKRPEGLKFLRKKRLRTGKIKFVSSNIRNHSLENNPAELYLIEFWEFSLSLGCN